MNKLDAFYRTVHDAPGGAESLAPRMGMAVGILRNKANVNSTTNIVSFDDVDLVMGLTGDYRCLHALAANHSHVCIPVENAAPSDMAVLEIMAKCWATNGDFGAEVSRALGDGRIDQREIATIKARALPMIAAIQQLVARLEGMADK